MVIFLQDEYEAVPPLAASSPRRTAAAARGREIHSRKSAIRALDDPVALARAARIVRVALERQRLTLADLEPDPPLAALPAPKPARQAGRPAR